MESELETQFKSILKANGIDDEIREVQVEAGEQIASECRLVTAHFVDGNKKPLDIFVKEPLDYPVYSRLLREANMFRKEADFFSTLLPDMQRFALQQPGYNGFLDKLFVKCYHSSENMIAFENLAKKGFTLRDKKIRHDLEIATKIYKTVAEFHAVSFAFIQHLGFEKFQDKYAFVSLNDIWDYTEAARLLNGPWLDFTVSGAIKILSEVSVEGSEKALEFFKKYDRIAFEESCKLYKPGNSLCPNVVIHADVWNNNFMFKQSDDGKLEDVKLIDYQTVRFGTPVMDLEQYAFIAIDLSLLRSSWKKLLKVYYDHFSEHVEILGQKVTFSLQDLEKDFQAKCLTGFFSMHANCGFDIFNEVGDYCSQSNPTEHFIQTLTSAVDRLIKEDRKKYAENVVLAFNVLQDILAGVET